MFGRRKSTIPKGRLKQATAQPTTPVAKPVAPIAAPAAPRGPKRPAHYSQHVLPIVVQQSVYDRGGADLVYGLVCYVNSMMEDGSYDSTQIPAQAMQSYHTDLYLAQVNNGGHSQFIGNLLGPHFDDTIRNIHAGLQGIGAQSYIQIFAEFLKWMRENPRLVPEQTGFGDIPEALNALDTRFYGLSRTQNLSDLNAKWIESWKELRVVPDQAYESEMQKLFDSNPSQAANDRVRAIRAIEYELLGGPTAKLNYVGFKSNQHILVTKMLPGNNHMIEGRSVPVFPIQTSMGLLLGVFSDHWVGIYRPIAEGKPRSIHIVMNSELEAVTALITQHKAAAALDLLIGKWMKTNKLLSMTPHLNPHGKLAVILTTETAKLFVVTFGDQGARFFDPEMNLISAVSRREILTHSASSI